MEELQDETEILIRDTNGDVFITKSATDRDFLICYSAFFTARDIKKCDIIEFRLITDVFKSN